MHAALREVLGTHVKQARVVAPNYLRFDYAHYQPLTPEEKEEIERLVNYHILRNEPVQTDEMAIDEAMRSGAMALFGEKYGERECYRSKARRGLLERIVRRHARARHRRHRSVQDRERRIDRFRSATHSGNHGCRCLRTFSRVGSAVDELRFGLRTSRSDLPATVTRLQEELKKARREADDLRLKIASGAIGAGGMETSRARSQA